MSEQRASATLKKLLHIVFMELRNEPDSNALAVGLRESIHRFENLACLFMIDLFIPIFSSLSRIFQQQNMLFSEVKNSVNQTISSI